jgi:superfamily I DNA/RNA helicase
MRIQTSRCVCAGPGSGKTAVIVERLKFLSENGKNKCLALTFSRAAAKEMSGRLLSMEENYVEVSTFHSFSYKIIRQCWPMMGYSKRPKPVPTRLAKSVLWVSHFLVLFTRGKNNLNRP